MAFRSKAARSKTIRSIVHVLLGAVCVVAVPSPLLLATTVKGAALLQRLIPGLPLSIAHTAPKSPPPNAPQPTDAEAPPSASEKVPGAVLIQSLPSREVHVTVANVNTDESATFSVGVNGRTRVEQAAAIERFFRCRRTGRHKPLADSVLALLADIAQRWPGKVIEVVSGYRAPPFGVRHSKHFAGHAIDLRVRGVRTSKVRDFVWREHHEVGVGHYAVQNFVHVDSRPGDNDTAWSAPHEDSPPQYSPRWAKRARRQLRPSVSGPVASALCPTPASSGNRLVRRGSGWQDQAALFAAGDSAGRDAAVDAGLAAPLVLLDQLARFLLHVGLAVGPGGGEAAQRTGGAHQDALVIALAPVGGLEVLAKTPLDLLRRGAHAAGDLQADGQAGEAQPDPGPGREPLPGTS